MSGFSPAFERLGAACAAIAVEQQEALADFLPDAGWNADLTTGTFTQGEVTLRIALLGSYAEQQRSWLWGWANPQFGEGHPAVVDTRALGARLGAPELTTPELDLSWYDGPARNTGDLLAMATTGLLGLAAAIPGDYAGGVAYFAVDDPALPRPPWSSSAAPRLITSGITLFPADHRLTVMRFFSHHRLPYIERERSVTARLPEGGTCTAEFDEMGRLAGVTMDPNAAA
jgi:hypothetical protein